MSGRINLSNLSDSLKEHLNSLGLSEEQVNEIVENALVEINEKNVEQDEVVNGLVDKVGELNGLMTEEKGDLVGAINELFQSANNGKELIASAIGEPVSADDTFSAMSNDINSLLSTFKTNMMNNGVTVESSDRFKSLIDKIATLSDSDGKGVQFAQGSVKAASTLESFSISTASWFNGFRLEVNDLTFKPSIIILTYNENEKEMPLGFASTLVDTIQFWFYNRDDRYFYQHSLGEYYYDKITPNLTDNGFLLYATIGSQQYNYYAFGVGEEDTTLRDSLASILQGEGVSVTEEDDMASLITKVDEEFDRKIDVKIGSYTTEITMTKNIQKITIIHNLGKAPSFVSIYIPYTSLYYYYSGYEYPLQESTNRAMNFIIDSRVYYDNDHRFIVMGDSNRYMHAYITDITNTSFSFAMCCGMEGSGYEIHLDSFDWFVM